MLLLASEGNYPLLIRDWLCFWDYQKGQLERYKPLDIQDPSRFSFSQYNYHFSEESEFQDYIASLEQERDYLLSVGRYVEAEMIDEEVEYFKNQWRIKKQQVEQG